MKLFKKNPLLLRHSLSYAPAVFVPIVLALLMMVYTNNMLKQEVFDSNQASVELIQESLDSTFQELEETLSSIGNNEKLNRYYLWNQPNEAITILSDIAGSHTCLDELILTIRGEDLLYSMTGNLNTNDPTFQKFMRDFQNVGYSGADWLSMMETVAEPFYWSSLSKSSSANSSYLYLISPLCHSLQMDGSVANRAATMIVRQDYIQNLFYSSQTSSDEALLLLSQDFSLLSKLTTRQTDGYVSGVCDYIKNHPEVLEDGYAELPGSDLLLFVSRSEKTGLSYVRFLPKSQAYRSIHSLQIFSIVVMLFAVIIGIMLTTSGLRHSCTPIRSLADWIRRQRSATDGINDELVFFRSVLNNAFAQNATLNQAADASRQGLIDHLLTNLICGNYASEEAFHRNCQELGVHLDKPYYAVCSLLIEESGAGAEAIRFDRIYGAICRDLPACYQMEAKDLLSAGKLILVISSDNNDPQTYQSAMSNIKNRLLEQEKLVVSIGMGPFYDSCDKVGKSYIDSVNALDFRLVYGQNCLITPDIGSSASPGLAESYPSYDLDLFESALMSHNAEMAVTVLRRINTTVRLKNDDLHIAKYICYDIFSILKKTPDLADMIRVDTLPPSLDVTNLTDRSAIDAFFAALIETLQAWPAVPIEPAPPVQSSIGTQLVEYIDAHCLSYDFQIKNIAEHFSISPQYMRKLFKTHAGITVSEYVSNKRLEKSMYLLTQTDMSLQDITAEIGNSDISGFVRFFKQKTGLTPGQYRKAHKQQD